MAKQDWIERKKDNKNLQSYLVTYWPSLSVLQMSAQWGNILFYVMFLQIYQVIMVDIKTSNHLNAWSMCSYCSMDQIGATFIKAE